MIVTNPAVARPLSIRTLGALTIALGEETQPMRFATRTVEALLVYLACQDRPLSRDELAELLWPERTQEQARMNLRVALYRLRGQVDPYLLITRQQLALNPAAVVDLDARQFERRLAAGQLAMAAALYRGDFLGGFYLDGSPAFEQWALLERERLRTLAIGAYQRLIDQAATAGQLDAATAHAQRLLQLDPWHEPTHRRLMRLLAHAGQRSAALAQYETCRNLLASELGAAPDEATTALYERIRTQTQDGAIGGDAATSSGLTAPLPVVAHQQPAAPPRKLHNLPLQPTPFIGRSAELEQIASLLSNPDCRLLTLLGVGGIGKTRLAAEAARRVLAAVPVEASKPQVPHQDLWVAEEVCFVALASVEKAELVLATIAQSLELQTSGSELQAAVAAYLERRTSLLVLDNFEHLPEAADTLAQLLQQAPGIKLLVTSRARLYLREEWLMPLAGLALAEGLLSEAGQLFIRSAQRVQPGFASDGQEEAIAAICAQVEGLPLALELAASWVRVMPCAEIARQLAQNMQLFTTTLRNVPERHRSLSGLFDQSWRLLSPTEQSVLRRASVFRGGWTLDEAAQVAGATLRVLAGLVDKSLVRTDGQGRFDLHELVRQYAAEQLDASGETGLIHQSHYGAYLHLFRTADSQLRGPDAAAWFAHLKAEQDNLRAALQWALDTERYADATWLVLAANWFWEQHGLQSDTGRFLVQLLPHRHQLAPDLQLALWIILNAASVHLPGAFQAIGRATDEVMELLEACSDKLLQSAAWTSIASNSTDFSQRSIFSERGIALARAAGEAPGLGSEFCLLTDRDWVLGTELLMYAAHLLEYGEFARAAPLARENVSLFHTRGNRYERAGGLGILGHLALLQGDLEQAHQLLAEAVTVASAVNYRELVRSWQPLLGRVLLYSGDATAARRLLTESLQRCIDLKLKRLLARNCIYLAETAFWEGRLDEAEQWLAQSLADDTELRSITVSELDQLWVAARLATAQQRYERAAALFGLAGQVHSTIHDVITGPMRALADAALATVRAELDPAVFAAAFETGRQLSLAEAFATILAPAHGAPA